MNLGLAGRTALVLGGTRGLGLACATSLASEGARVIVNGRDETHGRAVAAAIGNAFFVAGDVGADAPRSALIGAVSEIAQPDIVVTNAGGPPAGSFEDTD